MFALSQEGKHSLAGPMWHGAGTQPHKHGHLNQSDVMRNVNTVERPGTVAVEPERLLWCAGRRQYKMAMILCLRSFATPHPPEMPPHPEV
mmetsp:Transcript_82340/g.137701  ORF Transcript_82340/g.137701 Transcript_82340/m.137701 type:complete len:90 (+) Transcript_82340:122-391(+)